MQAIRLEIILSINSLSLDHLHKMFYYEMIQQAAVNRPAMSLGVFAIKWLEKLSFFKANSFFKNVQNGNFVWEHFKVPELVAGNHCSTVIPVFYQREKSPLIVHANYYLYDCTAYFSQQQARNFLHKYFLLAKGRIAKMVEWMI